MTAPIDISYIGFLIYVNVNDFYNSISYDAYTHSLYYLEYREVYRINRQNSRIFRQLSACTLG